MQSIETFLRCSQCGIHSHTHYFISIAFLLQHYHHRICLLKLLLLFCNFFLFFFYYLVYLVFTLRFVFFFFFTFFCGFFIFLCFFLYLNLLFCFQFFAFKYLLTNCCCTKYNCCFGCCCNLLESCCHCNRHGLWNLQVEEEREREEGEKLLKFRLVSFCCKVWKRKTATLKRDVDGISFLIRPSLKLAVNFPPPIPCWILCYTYLWLSSQ